MSWFKGTHPSRIEMRRELKLYLGVAHGTKKHVPRTQVLLRKLWAQARSRPFFDVWPTLDAMADVTALGTITGASIKSAFRRRLLELQGGAVLLLPPLVGQYGVRQTHRAHPSAAPLSTVLR